MITNSTKSICGVALGLILTLLGSTTTFASGGLGLNIQSHLDLSVTSGMEAVAKTSLDVVSPNQGYRVTLTLANESLTNTVAQELKLPGRGDLLQPLANDTWGYTTDLSKGFTSRRQQEIIVSKSPTSHRQYDLWYGVKVNRTVPGNYTGAVEYTITPVLDSQPQPQPGPRPEPRPHPQPQPVVPVAKVTSVEAKALRAHKRSTIVVKGANLPLNKQARLLGKANFDLVIKAQSADKLVLELPETVKPGNYQLTLDQVSLSSAQSNITVWPSGDCVSGNKFNTCKVVLPSTMVAVRSLGDNSYKIVDPKSSEFGEWYDYGSKMWAEAVTLDDGIVPKVGAVLSKMQIRHHWVYVPRFDYEVRRRDAIDRPAPEVPFRLVFSNSQQQPKRPAPTCSTVNAMKVYYTDCNISRKHSDKISTWATHPSFIQDNSPQDGIWISDAITPFESGIVKTNAESINGYVRQYHQPVHWANSLEWGGLVYLSDSSYGAGNLETHCSSSSSTPSCKGLNDMGETIITSTMVTKYGLASMSAEADEQYSNGRWLWHCRFETCGGYALHELSPAMYGRGDFKLEVIGDETYWASRVLFHSIRSWYRQRDGVSIAFRLAWPVRQ